MTARVKRIVLRQIIDDKRCLSAPITFNSVMHVNDYLGRGHTYLRRKLNNNQHIISSSGEPKKFFIVERINSQLVKTEKEELLRYFKTYHFYDGDIDLNGNECSSSLKTSTWSYCGKSMSNTRFQQNSLTCV